MAIKNIVLIHGWGASSSKLELLASRLHDMGWRVSIPKLPGFDIKPPKSVWGVGEYAQYIHKEAFREFGREKYILFGHSFGGRVSIRTSLLDKSVYGLVLCAMSGISRGNSLKRWAFKNISVAGRLLDKVIPLGSVWRKLMYMAAREHDYERSTGIMREVFKKVVEEDSKGYLPVVKIPILVLWGRQDKMTPVNDAYTIGKFVKKTKVVIFSGVGHQLPYKEPLGVAMEIDKWIKGF